jgi:hypothetical protein
MLPHHLFRTTYGDLKSCHSLLFAHFYPPVLSKLVQQIISFWIFSSKKFIHVSFIHFHVAKHLTTLVKILSNVVRNIFHIFHPCHQKMFENKFHHVHRLMLIGSQNNIPSFIHSFSKLLVLVILLIFS